MELFPYGFLRFPSLLWVCLLLQRLLILSRPLLMFLCLFQADRTEDVFSELGLHMGRERREAFREAGLADPTVYED